tara:strand:+ start:32 stop:547 length:516 start_codon:yes stop_codon:yes gene_type:complete
MVNKFIFIFYRLIYNELFKFKLRNKKVCVFDLDNTIYNTWPELVKKSRVFSYKNISIFNNMQMLVNKRYIESDIVFLSARKIKFYMQTFHILKRDFPNIKFTLILVEKTKDKLFYLDFLNEKSKILAYYDDLSYNHENDKIIFYKSVIDSVKKMKINYFGLNEIIKINNNE